MSSAEPFIFTPAFTLWSRSWRHISSNDASILRFNLPYRPPPWQGYVIIARRRGHTTCECMLSEPQYFAITHHPHCGDFPVSWQVQEQMAVQWSLLFPQFVAVGDVSYCYRDPHDTILRNLIAAFAA